MKEDTGSEKFTPVKAASDIFKDSGGKTIRTVLTVGKADIGKSFHVESFIKEWADQSLLNKVTGKFKSMWSNPKDEGVIIPLDLSKLNSFKDEKVSLEGLLHHFFKETEQCEISNFEKFKVTFVLDGLDAFKPALDFDKNDTVTDVREQASVSVILTSLIKGTLLPSARLWITSRPSAVDQLPDIYVNRRTEIRYKGFRQRLTDDLKSRLLHQHENKLKKQKTETELYVTDASNNKEDKVPSMDALFLDSKKKRVRTVLMKGVPGVGKTHQTMRHMVDWANGGSNKDIDFIVPFHFPELNSKRDQSMRDLLQHSLNPEEISGVLHYDKCKILFVLDGLEKCELPLSFEKNEDLNDVEKPAPMDVLLTNLIKGNLLPSAVIWIITQPSGAQKIPPEHILKVTECQTKGLKQRLTDDLKIRLLDQHKSKLEEQETETELYVTDASNNKEDKVPSMDALFLDSKKKRVRTVLMKGVPGVGKTHQTMRHMVDWANGRSNKDIDFIVPFHFPELNSKRDQSMRDLLQHSLNPEEISGVLHYDKCKILFVLDGLEKCELPLSFENNEDLNDVEKPAPMDVLLTNLIKGNLLPSAVIWIITQPSGAQKIPPEHILKVTECQTKGLKQRLTDDLKIRLLDQHKSKLEEQETETELYVTDASNNKEDKVPSMDALFLDSKKKRVRTVLMKGVPGVGKTHQTMRHMVDWANGRSNKDIDFIVPFHFPELNSKRDQSMRDLLQHSLNPEEISGVLHYDKCKILFVLDGLEKCELPLSFENNEDLNDVEKPAPMDVLLTNLIKGNLLPSAVIWIITQPSGAQKIPPEHILKVTECQNRVVKQRLTADLKRRLLHQHKSKLEEQKTETELYVTDASNNKEDKVHSMDALFHHSKKKRVRTVLMKGVPGVGKTHQTMRHMVDWAKGRSNKDIDFIVPFHFPELKSKSDKDQSMRDLLQHSLNPEKISGVCDYDKCKILFVLDGLEKCELPLSFEKNEDLNDVEKPAPMDVLLTNLIRGKLLPSAVIWIITQPSGAQKIPPEHILKVTECRETSERRKKLISTLRQRFRETIQDGDITHSNQKDTEHIMKEEKSSETNDEEKDKSTVVTSVTQVNAVSDIFKEKSGTKIRNVLTVGVTGIGKSFHVNRFIKEWANEGSLYTRLRDRVMSFWEGGTDENAVLFPLNLYELNLRKEEKVSLLGLLNHFFMETKQIVISNYEQLRVLFVLDGLDAFEPALDFDNNDAVTDVREPASVSVILTSLIKGTLLPSARLWITSRPPAVHQLPVTCVNRRTEIRYKTDLASKWALKDQLKEQFTHVALGIDMQKTSTLLNDIYTDLYIIEGERGEVELQHEARQIEGAKFKPQETSIKYHAIFEPGSLDKHIRSVLTTGMAGIGKSFATMKYMLDWAEDSSHTDIFFMFPLSFRELNLRKEETHSLEGLLHSFFPGMITSEIKDYDKYKILIVLDGFDECRLDLVFNESDRCKDMKQETSVKVLLANLIQGNLLSKAQIWITSRPAASNSIPADKVDRVTEVRGFNDEQKEEYFKKRFDDKDLAEKILSHVKNSRTIYIMCHLPVFCWLTSKVLEDFVERKEEGKMPSTLTDMYIHFLLLQCRQANVKYGTDETSVENETCENDSCWNTRNKSTVVSLGKLAFEGLQTGDLVFTEETLTGSGVDITKAAVFSGMFTQIKREGLGLCQQKLFCFVHLSIQEFLASFYVFHTFNDRSENLLTEPPSTVADLPGSEFYKTAVDKALGSKNGDWDLFLRFLLGLSLETNQKLLRELLKKTENNKEINEETIRYIKEKIREEKSDADQNFNFFHCLNELNDQTLVDEVKKYLHSDSATFENFSTSQWSALTFVLLTSDENLDVFDLKKYRKSEQVLLGMMPVVKVAKTAQLSWCELSTESCEGLKSSILTSASCNLTQLDLSHNDLLDAGVKHLAEGLSSLHCKLEILRLSGCQVTEEGCLSLASALRSNTASSLKQLDLSYNHPGAKGAAKLSAIVEDPKMSLKTLCLDHCGEHRLKPGIKKYDGVLTLDENTASRRLVLSDGNKKVRTVKKVEEKVQREENADRFKRSQVSCKEGQKGLCYWEVEWKGTVGIAVAYRGVGRKWDSKSGLGCNDNSWSLLCSQDGYTAIHGKTKKHITEPFSQKIAVYLDCEAGTLSYYCDKSGELSLIHTFKAQFRTEPVYPGFWFKRGSVTLCEIDETPLRWSEVKAQHPEVKKKPTRKLRPKVSKPAVPQVTTSPQKQ
ncbi:uncharacterized protein LOC117822148 [Notolabrus celidotus]|uniref:uncharacterized protein LOC117822148 n=1 Tax=Notolabrus celidotus TaxID=1203425 RepID=UPI00149060B7|nr:uncharacterized protein LOC117822148 [Notolabrus celidotus]